MDLRPACNNPSCACISLNLCDTHAPTTHMLASSEICAPRMHARRDDVGDHDKWAQHFGCPRVLHEEEVTQSTVGVEVKLKGAGPWSISGQALDSSTAMISGSTSGDMSSAASSGSSSGTSDDEDVVLLYTPGHSKAHVCLLHRPSRTLFAGAR